eukprot:356163-Chlamydomonas_euryale.AAC.3
MSLASTVRAASSVTRQTWRSSTGFRRPGGNRRRSRVRKMSLASTVRAASSATRRTRHSPTGVRRPHSNRQHEHIGASAAGGSGWGQ